MADPLHDFAAGLAGQIVERRIPRAAFADAGGYLDQFVIGEGAIKNFAQSLAAAVKAAGS